MPDCDSPEAWELPRLCGNCGVNHHQRAHATGMTQEEFDDIRGVNGWEVQQKAIQAWSRKHFPQWYTTSA